MIFILAIVPLIHNIHYFTYINKPAFCAWDDPLAMRLGVPGYLSHSYSHVAHFLLDLLRWTHRYRTHLDQYGNTLPWKITNLSPTCNLGQILKSWEKYIIPY